MVDFAFRLSSGSFSRIENRSLRFVCRAGFLAVAVGVSIPVSLSLQPLLPDFRAQGDGGVGMAHNALSNAALFAAVPCGLMLAAALMLSRAVPAIPEAPKDPFEADST
ncbi:hypothetical protein [Rubripirellula tenax]|uniref:hypothetical protein n=1 Tax=Rubripirellula tenax TaxID=2528015 RepID=UPI001C95E923|nr:hypothetical protein [Rubripirellula tenax]